MRDAVTKISTHPLAQFGALTFVDEAGARFVVFRGTDTTAVGWAEDARFGLEFPTIAQRWAARYLDYAAGRGGGPLTVIGHSKGGNLALYAAASSPPSRASMRSTRWVFPRRSLTTVSFAALTGECVST